MLKKKDKNPNTVERMEEHYKKIIASSKGERFNDWMMEHLDPLIPTSKQGAVLEVGCGLGATLDHVLKININLDVFGIDISPTAVDYCNERFDGGFKAQHAEDEIPFPTYNLIICSQTLEHVDSPNECMMNMKAALVSGGTLFITVPYPKSSLDDGVKLHYWRFYPQDFTGILPGCKVFSSDQRHLIVVWKKP